MSPADRARAEREQQQLPATVTDGALLDSVAVLLTNAAPLPVGG
jgi:hypothetical protein